MQEIAEVFGINWKLLLVQAFNFGILLLALWYFLYRPVILLLEKRRKVIEKGVADAEKSEKRLEEIEGERDNIISKATSDGGQIISDSKVRATEKVTEIVSDANVRAESILTDASARAQEVKKRVLRESEDEIAKTAILAAEKIIRNKS